jgi:hypothetical protein
MKPVMIVIAAVMTMIHHVCRFWLRRANSSPRGGDEDDPDAASRVGFPAFRTPSQLDKVMVPAAQLFPTYLLVGRRQRPVVSLAHRRVGSE